MSVVPSRTKAVLRGHAGRAISDAVNLWCRFRYDKRRTYHSDREPSDAVVSSFFSRSNGVASGGRMQIDAFRGIGLRTGLVDATPGIRNPFKRSSSRPTPGSVVAHADGRMVGLIFNYLGGSATEAHRVGYCAWELATPPKDWMGFDRILHEVWTPSTFSANSLHKICTSPVRVVPHVVESMGGGGPAMRQRLGLHADEFVVLTMADLRSSLARKNPFAAIAAFTRALGSDKDATLVVKVTGSGHDASAWNELQRATRGTRVLLIDAHYSNSDQWALLDACDVLVSLHRAEGFGLPMAEAMSLGKAVVATNWSGNLNFMDEKNACLVDYKMVDIKDPQGIYKDGHWAEPEIDHAAAHIKRLFDDRQLMRDMGAAAARRFARETQLAEFRASLSEEFLYRIHHNRAAT